MSHCRNCTSKRVYILTKLNTKPMDDTIKSEITKVAAPIRNFPQCLVNVRYSLDKKEAVTEICRPVKVKESDIKTSFNSFQIMTQREASNYIAVNTDNWNTTDD